MYLSFTHLLTALAGVAASFSNSSFSENITTLSVEQQLEKFKLAMFPNQCFVSGASSAGNLTDKMNFSAIFLIAIRGLSDILKIQKTSIDNSLVN